MIEWFTIVAITVAVAAGVIALASGIRGTAPRDLTVLSTLAVEVVLVAQLVLAIAQPAFGNVPQGDPLEFWMYLITALLMPPAVVIWAIVDKTKWGTLAMGGVSLSVAVMLVRMSVIWTGV
ncbi:MAG: hypothetical protein RJA31_1136 [Actinomycetota bacterium]|jgi:hypothetical protein